MPDIRVAEYVARLADDRAAIFLFHGVVESLPYRVRNYNRKHLSADAFRAVLEGLLSAGGRPLTMNDVYEHCRNGEPYPPKAFAVTFDDGFRNNLTVALPIMRSLGVPATFYLTTRFIDENAMSWVDRLEHAFERMTHGSVQLPWEARRRDFATAQEQIAVLADIRTRLKSDPAADLDAAVSQIVASLGVEEVRASDDPLDAKLSWQEVRTLAAQPDCIVGGHSHSHGILSFLAPAELEPELDLSFSLLAEKGGVASHHYSYPEGLRHCYSEPVIEALKRRGIGCCPSAEDGLNDPGTDPFRLKRIFVV